MANLESRVKRRKLNQMSPAGVLAAHQQAAAMRMRIDGFTYEEISTKLGISEPRMVMETISRGIKRTLLDSVEQYRNIELLRLESIHRLVWKRIKMGRLDQVPNVLRIMERRAKLLGLDAPERHDILLQEVERLADETGLDKKKILGQVDEILKEAQTSNRTKVFDSRWAS